MNKMFKRVESELTAGGNTKVWLAKKLSESTQNINNWKRRGVPASKVKAIAHALGVSREYLEGSIEPTSLRVEASGADYRIQSKPVETKPVKHPHYLVYVDLKDSQVDKLLRKVLHRKDDLSYLLCSAWSNAEPFIELSVYRGDNQTPWTVMVLHEYIIGITDNHANRTSK